MGNETTCQRFCEHKQEEQNNEITSQIRINEYPLQCQICHKQVEHTNFKIHIDKEHFACIEEKDQHITVVCVLCEGVSGDLDGHKLHLQQKHSYAKLTQDKNTNENSSSHIQKQVPYSPYKYQYLSNKLIKSRLKQIDNTSRFRVITQLTPIQSIIQYQSHQYLMHKLSKQYNGMEYDENQIVPELVYFPVFTLYRSTAKFYVVEKFPLEKTIQCNAYIICQKS